MSTRRNTHMPKHTLTKDIHDKDGRLIMPKGTVVDFSGVNFAKFRQLGIYNKIAADIEETKAIKNNRHDQATRTDFLGDHYIDDNLSSDQNDDYLFEYVSSPSKYNAKREEPILQLAKKFNLNDRNLNRATSIVKDIMYNSENKTWYNHFITLTNYVEWLYAHSINTALISTIVGLELKFSTGQIRALATGALLHDIGLILLPKNVITNSTNLSDFESEILARHAEMGYSMLLETELPDISKKIILQHHEALDGSGYPNHIKSKDICYEAKIVMVVETFDTATTSQPGQIAMAPNEVIAKMLETPHIYDKEIVTILAKSLLGKDIYDALIETI